MRTDLHEYLSLRPIDARYGDTATGLISRTLVCLFSLSKPCRSRAGTKVLVHECITGRSLRMHSEAYQGSLGNGPARSTPLGGMPSGQLLTQHSTIGLDALGFGRRESQRCALLCHHALVIWRLGDIESPRKPLKTHQSPPARTGRL